MTANDATTMHWTALVSAEDLSVALGGPGLAIIDARFGLGDPGQGERDYIAGHIPGAVYAHLDRHLSDHARIGHGRHPLPDAKAFRERLGAWGIAPAQQVVVYDARDGTMAAARAWFMLKLLGHDRVAVLDGGFARWTQLGLPVTTELAQRQRVDYVGDFDASLVVDADDLMHPAAANAPLLIDARAAERFRGDVEPLDIKAGYVPGAINCPFSHNLHADGRFRSVDELAAGYRALLNGREPHDVVMMCGSGVTACHNLLAMEHAGLPAARLYADSWSGWISDPSRPIATGTT